MTGGPVVTIGLPVRNGAAFVGRAIESLRRQRYEPLEIVISDNGSTDATPVICRRAAAEDSRVHYLRSDVNCGAAWNYVRVFACSRGPYFKWAAHDDLCHPGFVADCVAALEADPGAVLAYPRTSVIDVDDRVVGDFEDGLALDDPSPSARFARLLAHVGEYHPIFGVIRRAGLEGTEVMGAYVGADVVTLAELALRGRFVEVPERLFLRRYHRGTSVIANPDPLTRALWFDPNPPTRRPMPTTRLAWELLRAVRRAPVGLTTRARCTTLVARRWVAPRWRDVGGEVRRRVCRPEAVTP